MNLDRIGIAVIGTGRAGRIHAANFSGRVRGGHLVAVVDAAEDAARAAAEYLEIETALTDFREAVKHPQVDAVVIATPTEFHAEIALAALEAGKHLLCEKPMAMTVEDCDAIIDAAGRAGVVLQLGFVRRYSDEFLAAKKRVDAGDIGKVVQVRSLTHAPTPPKPWMFDLRKSNGALAEVTSHDIDTARWFCGAEFTEVYAIAGNYRTPEARETYPDFYDQVLLQGRMSDGSQASITGGHGVRYAFEARCEILGTDGLIAVGSAEGASVVAYTKDGESRRPLTSAWAARFEAAFAREDSEFLDCIREGKPPRAGGRDGRAAALVVDAGNRSIRERRPEPIR